MKIGEVAPRGHSKTLRPGAQFADAYRIAV